MGACVICDPPDDRLLEFARFGMVHPSLFWPVVDCEVEEIDFSKVHSMVAPPIERVLKESHEEDEPFMEYRIVVTEQTTLKDVENAFRAIKAAYKTEDFGGRPLMNKLIALQCAILYDDHNERDPQDPRRWKWTHKKLAEKFKLTGKGGQISTRAAKAHIKEGRELRRNKPQPKE